MKQAKRWFRLRQKGQAKDSLSPVSIGVEAWQASQDSKRGGESRSERAEVSKGRKCHEDEREGDGREDSERPTSHTVMEDLQLDDVDLFRRGLNTSILQAMWFEEHALLDSLMQLHHELSIQTLHHQLPTQRGEHALAFCKHSVRD